MTADQAKAVRDLLTGTIEHEAKTTRRVLAAVPHGNRDYRPDPRSRTAWELALHIAISDAWFADSIVAGKFERSGETATPPGLTDPEAVATFYDREIAEGIKKLRAMTAEELLRPVQFFHMTAPAVTYILTMNNHSVHHRGQLAGYLRAAGSKVPAIYGVSADENAFG